MARNNRLSPADLRDLVDYDPEAGAFIWRVRPSEMFKSEGRAIGWNKLWAGKITFAARDGHGYLNAHIFGQKYLAHRAAWAIYHDEWPSDQIDHINGDRTDNRIENLRVVTNRENGRNQKRRASNTSGITGVYWHKPTSKWFARISVDEGEIHLGTFNCFLAAGMVRRRAEEDHGYHENHGRTHC